MTSLNFVLSIRGEEKFSSRIPTDFLLGGNESELCTGGNKVEGLRVCVGGGAAGSDKCWLHTHRMPRSVSAVEVRSLFWDERITYTGCLKYKHSLMQKIFSETMIF